MKQLTIAKKTYIPYMCDHALVLGAVFRAFGLSAEVLPPPDDEPVETSIPKRPRNDIDRKLPPGVVGGQELPAAGAELGVRLPPTPGLGPEPGARRQTIQGGALPGGDPLAAALAAGDALHRPR